METTPDNLPENSLDLNSLSIGPEWATSSAPSHNTVPRHFREERGEREFRGPHGDSRDPRSARPDRRGSFRPRRDDTAPPASYPPSRPDRANRDPRHGADAQPARRDGPPPRWRDHDRGGNRGERFHDRDRNHDRAPLRDSRRSDFAPRSAPVAEVIFFPEEKPFAVLVKAIKASLRTYDLFEITRLILEKNDRFLVGCRPYGAENNPAARIYQSIPDQLPFLSESDAIAHVHQCHLDLFFKSEVVTVDPPKGVFLMVSRCGFTGEILGPPNYHGYQQTLREFHAARLPHVSFERFTSRIESVRDKELIDQWLQRMTQVTRYTLKEPREGEPTQFDSADAARNFLLARRKEQVVRACPHMRFPGKLIETLPFGPLRTTIENELRFQRTFPLVTATALRGRLRKLGFVLYKAGARDITYVSAVERKFRTPDARFADSIQRVVDFIEKNPRVKVSELPEKFLGISPSTPKTKTSAPKGKKPAPDAAAKTPVAETPAAETPVAETPIAETPAAESPVPETPENTGTPEVAEVVSTDAAPDAATQKSPSTTETEPESAPASEPESTPVPEPEPAPEAEAQEAAPEEPKTETPAAETPETSEVPAAAEPEAAAPTVTDVPATPVPPPPATPPVQKSAPTPATPAPFDLSNPAIRELLNTLRWLVSEGYVTEFSDGGLFVNPVLTEAQLAARSAPNAGHGKKKKFGKHADKNDNIADGIEKSAVATLTETPPNPEEWNAPAGDS
jgi:hypothetical protein